MRYRSPVIHIVGAQYNVNECSDLGDRSSGRCWRRSGQSSKGALARCRCGDLQLAVRGDERRLHIALRHYESETGARGTLRPGKDGDAFAGERMEHPANEPSRTEQLLADDGDERNIRFKSKGTDDSARQIRSEFLAQRMQSCCGER